MALRVSSYALRKYRTLTPVMWLDSIVQMQAIVSELIERFEFELAYPAEDILRVPAVITNPMVRHKLDDGVQLPLKVTAIY
jgi:hypothetical protein